MGLYVWCVTMRNYRNIEAWKLADDLAVVAYEITRGFPREEAYGLTSQLRRSASSVPTNIVEGSGRETNRDYLHFLYIARGSLNETQYLIHLAIRLGYLTPERAAEIIGQTKRTFGCLHGLIRAVEREVGKLGRIVSARTPSFSPHPRSRNP